jgi:hypothetical protein
MLFNELQLDRKSIEKRWRLSKRWGSCLHFYRNFPEKNLRQFDTVGAWSEQRFTLNVVERVIPVNESPMIWSVSIEQIRLENIYRYKINAFDPNGDKLFYRLVSDSVGVSISYSVL